MLSVFKSSSVASCISPFVLLIECCHACSLRHAEGLVQAADQDDTFLPEDLRYKHISNNPASHPPQSPAC